MYGVALGVACGVPKGEPNGVCARDAKGVEFLKLFGGAKGVSSPCKGEDSWEGAIKPGYGFPSLLRVGVANAVCGLFVRWLVDDEAQCKS